MKWVVTFALSLGLHLVLGWAWTLVAGVVGGYRWGVRVGALGVGAAWLLLVVYTFAVAARPAGEMVRIMGSLLGNLPGALVVALTVFLGILWGAVGGAVGVQLRLLRRGRAASRAKP